MQTPEKKWAAYLQPMKRAMPMEGLDARLAVEIITVAIRTPIFRYCVVAKDTASLTDKVALAFETDEFGEEVASLIQPQGQRVILYLD